jgi:hypothetical protein
MQNKQSKQGSGAEQNAQGNVTFQNQNPNQNHNAKKESLGPNTKK